MTSAMQGQSAPPDRPKVTVAPKAKSQEAPPKAMSRPGQASARSGASDRTDEPQDVAKADDPKEVRFKTAQGEASAWVQELSPPDELSASDPAAMLAWLASLTQQETQVAASLPPGGAQASGENPGAPDPAGQDALPSTNVLQMLGGKSLSDVGKLGAETGESSRPGAEGEQDQALAGFSALMNRETARLSSLPQGVDAPRHYTGSVNVPVNNPQFAQALTDRVSMWVSGPASNGPMTAELRLNPAEMGPVHIRIELDGQNAMVDFSAAHQLTREAIEASLPLLSGAMESAGLTLSGGGVSDQSQRQAWSGSREGGPQSVADRALVGMPSGAADAEPRLPSALASPALRPGGLDLYA
jgi:flagellar hook-length control protein FliK